MLEGQAYRKRKQGGHSACLALFGLPSLLLALAIPDIARAQQPDLGSYRVCTERHERYGDYHRALLATRWQPVSPSEEGQAIDAIVDGLLTSFDVTESPSGMTIDEFREANRSALRERLEHSLLRKQDTSYLLLSVMSGPNGQQRVLCWSSIPDDGTIAAEIDTLRQGTELLELTHGSAFGIGPTELVEESGTVQIRYFETSDGLELTPALTSRRGLMLDTIF